jgi:hypothetical protein
MLTFNRDKKSNSPKNNYTNSGKENKFNKLYLNYHHDGIINILEREKIKKNNVQINESRSQNQLKEKDVKILNSSSEKKSSRFRSSSK